jgi:hypothetical protein
LLTREDGTSGRGSYGHLADFKAEVINDIVNRHDVSSVIELGCGDGNQLSLLDVPRYLGLDVSPTAVRRCAVRFAGDATKSFVRYDPAAFVDRAGYLRADLAMSIDVLYHLVEDDVWELHLRHLFGAAERLVLIYAVDEQHGRPDAHVRHRPFTPWIEANLQGWARLEHVPNRYPIDEDPTGGSAADFHLFARR